MNFSKKLVMCVTLLCVVSFAQQQPAKNAPAKTAVVNSDKKVEGVVKPPANTWTKIKDLFM